MLYMLLYMGVQTYEKCKCNPNFKMQWEPVNKPIKYGNFQRQSSLTLLG